VILSRFASRESIASKTGWPTYGRRSRHFLTVFMDRARDIQRYEPTNLDVLRIVRDLCRTCCASLFVEDSLCHRIEKLPKERCRYDWHAHVNRSLHETLAEKVTSFIVTSTFDRLIFAGHALIGPERIHYADRRMRDERFPLRRRKRVREESWNETVVLALLNVRTLYPSRYRKSFEPEIK